MCAGAPFWAERSLKQKRGDPPPPPRLDSHERSLTSLKRVCFCEQQECRSLGTRSLKANTPLPTHRARLSHGFHSHTRAHAQPSRTLPTLHATNSCSSHCYRVFTCQTERRLGNQGKVRPQGLTPCVCGREPSSSGDKAEVLSKPHRKKPIQESCSGPT